MEKITSFRVDHDHIGPGIYVSRIDSDITTYDLRTKKPGIANKMGGFSGDAIFPVAVRMVYQVANAVKIPVVGMGGVSSAEDVIELMLAGATAVEVGAANLIDPYVCQDIINDLPAVMDKYKIKTLSEIIGGCK